IVGSEVASERSPMMIRMKVTNRPKLSANTTPKLEVLWFQSSTAETAAPTRPMAPSGPIGIRSPGARNASATMAASAAAVTQDIGTMALSAPNYIIQFLAGDIRDARGAPPPRVGSRLPPLDA